MNRSEIYAPILEEALQLIRERMMEKHLLPNVIFFGLDDIDNKETACAFAAFKCCETHLIFGIADAIGRLYGDYDATHRAMLKDAISTAFDRMDDTPKDITKH
jgi:hypothetical protein